MFFLIYVKTKNKKCNFKIKKIFFAKKLFNKKFLKNNNKKCGRKKPLNFLNNLANHFNSKKMFSNTKECLKPWDKF